ncbi:adenine deaminase [Leadbettera azotonutricia ZAS-9]|uniref:Adenine deaminase n=2 Tax=Leadbettera azotonutricia TaxID=150829 RepID=F5YCL0_LEAAZ|nr:adenine deaminase [Leadbettera azotonutricia ZAS-9]
MGKNELQKLMDTAAGRRPADLLIKNARIADVYSGVFFQGDAAVSGEYIAGIVPGEGGYEALAVVDAAGAYLLPGFIDSHIHIESSYLCPEEFGRLLVPLGTTTIITDPHEIVNIAGLSGLAYMLGAAEQSALDIKFMLPSCVPATPFDHAGARIDAQDMAKPLEDGRILGLGEFMDFPDLIGGKDAVLDKVILARKAGKLIDGHAPLLTGKDLNAYTASGIHTDHECTTVEEMQEKISRGMYAMLRQGSACDDLAVLVKGVTDKNNRRCLLCSDDLQPRTIRERGHMNALLKNCVEAGLAPMAAIRMATLNAAECFRLHDRGAIAPGLRADMVLVHDLENFHAEKVFIAGKLISENNRYLPQIIRHDDSAVRGTFHVRDFSKERLKLRLNSDTVYVIDVSAGSLITGKGKAKVKRDSEGCFVHESGVDIAKIAVVERHHNTGNIGLALLRGFGIKRGAIAISISHDSHNIITAGVSDDDIVFAVEELLRQNGGMALVQGGKLLAGMSLPLGGIMSDQSGEWVEKKLSAIYECARRDLGIKEEIDPVSIFAFMSLAVIPELKLTDMGLFDFASRKIIPLEAE